MIDGEAKNVETRSSVQISKEIDKWFRKLDDSVKRRRREVDEQTTKNVQACPTISNYNERASQTCAKACDNNLQDGNCEYHCMRDTSKTSLVEFCAEPKILFDFCPEYDPVGKRIQKDTDTLCNSSSPLNYYKSSDLFHCNPEKCLQLYGDGQKTIGTTMSIDRDIDKTLILGSSILLIIALAVFIMYIFQKRTPKRFRVWLSLCSRRNNQNEIIVPLSNSSERNRYLERGMWKPEDSVNCPNNGQCKPLCDGMDLGQPSSICTSNLKRHDSNSANLSTNLDRKNKQTDTDIK